MNGVCCKTKLINSSSIINRLKMFYPSIILFFILLKYDSSPYNVEIKPFLPSRIFITDFQHTLLFINSFLKLQSVLFICLNMCW